MNWQVNPYTIPLSLTALAAVVAAILFQWKSRTRASQIGSLIILLAAFWIAADAAEMALVDLPWKIFWSRIQIISITTLPLTWLAFSLYYTGQEKWLSPKRYLLLGIIPSIVLLLALSDETYGFLYSSIKLVPGKGFVVLEMIPDVGLWIHWAYSIILIIIGSLHLIRMFLRSEQRYRQQAYGLLAAVFIPLLSLVLEIIGKSPFPEIDIIPIGVAIGASTMAGLLNRLRLSDLKGVTRDFILEGIRDAIIVLDPENRIVDINSAAAHLVGHADETYIGQLITMVLPTWLPPSQYAQNGDEERFVFGLGEGQKRRFYDTRITPLMDWNDQLISNVIVMRDISDRVHAEDEIRKTLIEKDILLKEVHHRVNNNLQIVSSLLSLQYRNLQDEQVRERLQDSQNRIRSMALIHQKIHQSDRFTRINFSEYAIQLAKDLIHLYRRNSNEIKLKTQEREIVLGLDMAVPCGLIINELVSNSLKHAFPDNHPGEIYIDLFKDNERGLVMTVSDNGIG